MENANNKRYGKQLASGPRAPQAVSQLVEVKGKRLSLSRLLLRKTKYAVTILGVAALVLFSLPAYTQKGGIEQQMKTAPADSPPYEIQLQSRTFTPKAGVPANLGDRIKLVIDKADPETARAHVLVQLQSSPEPADRERFVKQGITLLTPLNKRTWFASVTAAGGKPSVAFKVYGGRN